MVSTFVLFIDIVLALDLGQKAVSNDTVFVGTHVVR
jgi:hypothetical protein